MKQNFQVSRRRFLQRTATLAGMAAGAQYIGMPSLLGAGSPNAKLGVAVIAADGMGGYSFDCAMRERFVAVSDVDDNKLAGKLKVFSDKVKDQPAPKAYYDYRKMLEECQKDIHAGPSPCPGGHSGHSSGQGRVFAETPGSQYLRVLRPGPGGAREERADANGQPRALQHHDSQGVRIYLGRHHRERD
jgi:hypothetical protein